MKRYDKYKDSGIKWLGDIPEHWEIAKNKYSFSYQKGKNPKEFSDEENENVYLSMDYLRGRNNSIQYIKNTKNLYRVVENQLLLLWDGANAGEFLVSKNGYLSSTMAHIKFNNRISPLFGRYYSVLIERELRNSTIGMGIPHVSSLELSNLEFIHPPLNEQVAIAKFLDTKCVQLDSLVAVKQQQIELLKERRQMVIHEAVTKGIRHAELNSGIEMKDSGIDWIGEIPKHWSVIANRVLFIERDQPGNDELPLLSVSLHTGVSKGELDEEENIRGKIKIQDKTQYKLVNKNDIVFNMMRAWQGAIGRVNIQGMVSPAYIVAKPIEQVNSYFIEYLFRTRNYINAMSRVSKGITDFRKRLYWNEFKQLSTILPPIHEQEEIVSYLEKQTSKIDQAVNLKIKQIARLKEYKQSLIIEVVTGKVKVS